MASPHVVSERLALHMLHHTVCMPHQPSSTVLDKYPAIKGHRGVEVMFFSVVLS